MIVGLLAEKGGTGKTTLATNLAGMRAAAGRTVLLVDADRQESSRFWAQTRSPLRLPRLDSTPLYGEVFAKQIATVASGYDDVVIDTGAADERDISGHFVALDFWGTITTVSNLLRLRLPTNSQDAFPILNIVDPHSPHLPRVASRPFFMVTCSASWISRLSRHFIQYPVIVKYPLNPRTSASAVGSAPADSCKTAWSVISLHRV